MILTGFRKNSENQVLFQKHLWSAALSAAPCLQLPSFLSASCLGNEAALLLGGTALKCSPGRSLCLTKSSACGRLWHFAHPRPLSLRVPLRSQAYCGFGQWSPESVCMYLSCSVMFHYAIPWTVALPGSSFHGILFPGKNTGVCLS